MAVSRIASLPVIVFFVLVFLTDSLNAGVGVQSRENFIDIRTGLQIVQRETNNETRDIIPNDVNKNKIVNKAVIPTTDDGEDDTDGDDDMIDRSTTVTSTSTSAAVSRDSHLDSGDLPKFLERTKKPTRQKYPSSINHENINSSVVAKSRAIHTLGPQSVKTSPNLTKNEKLSESSLVPRAQPHVNPKSRIVSASSPTLQSRRDIVKIVTQGNYDLYHARSTPPTLEMLDLSSSALESKDVLRNLNEIHVKLRLTDIILMVCGTLAGTLTLCMLVTVMNCCCKKRRKKKDPSSPHDSEETNGNTKYSGNTDGQGVSKQGPDILEVTVETHPQQDKGEKGSKASLKSHKSNEKFSSLTREQKAISVKDRIKEFEAPPSHEAVRRDDSKPKRKKPKSKAFEDFETSGILIGFGNSPHKRPRSGEEREEDERGEDEETLSQSGSEAGSGPCGGVALPYLPSSTDRSLDSDSIRADSDSGNIHNNSFFREDDEGIHTMDSDDDDFDRVTRDTEILKSFRKPPPPKNRGRGKRSFKKQGHHLLASGASSRYMPNMDESDESMSGRNTPIGQVIKTDSKHPRMSPSSLAKQRQYSPSPQRERVSTTPPLSTKSDKANTKNTSYESVSNVTDNAKGATNKYAISIPRAHTNNNKDKSSTSNPSLHSVNKGQQLQSAQNVPETNLSSRRLSNGGNSGVNIPRPYSYHDDLDNVSSSASHTQQTYAVKSSSQGHMLHYDKRKGATSNLTDDRKHYSPVMKRAALHHANASPAADLRRCKSDYASFPASTGAQVSIATIRDLSNSKENQQEDRRAFTSHSYDPIIYPTSEKLERKKICYDGLPPRYPKTDTLKRKCYNPSKLSVSKELADDLRRSLKRKLNQQQRTSSESLDKKMEIFKHTRNGSAGQNQVSIVRFTIDKEPTNV